jgi:hypothetical protein
MEDWNADGYLDLVCHFEDNPDNWEPGSGSFPGTVWGFQYRRRAPKAPNDVVVGLDLGRAFLVEASFNISPSQ